MKRINITQAATAFGVAGLLGVASLAFAGDQKPAVTDPAKLPKFANVTVVNKTPAQNAAVAKTNPTVGMKVAVDPSTGQIRPLSLEESAALSSTAIAAAPDLAGTATMAQAGAVDISSSDGSPGVLLDESSLAYAVATIGPDGKLRQACIEDQPDAQAALKTAAAQAKVNNNEK